MNLIERKRPPVVRLPPKSNLELLLARGSQVAMIVIGLIAFIFALHAGKMMLAPFTMAVVVGLMLGPIATRLEARGAPPALSALAVVFVFILAMIAFMAAVAAPLSYWTGRIPQIWSELQLKLINLQEPLNTLKSLRDEVRSVMGNADLTVQVEENSAVESMAVLAPALLAQTLVFFASLYFFVATRHQTRTAVLKLCLTRKLRWRTAHIFRDVEALVSKYLLSITFINFGLGAAVGLALWVCGVPSALLWGALAGLLNFVVYIGPAIMALILFMVGLATYDTLLGSLVPPMVYLVLNMIEAQFVTPTVIGRTMTMNPFIVFLAIAFWLWIWGPIGGFVAVPALLIVYAICRNIIPSIEWAPPETMPMARGQRRLPP
ncbi:putative PurR-regulated permease PerM [Mesorhizobium sp. J18]|uniref:AI-2E family transporter n=1 Tax=Mesorhizobium sp. J18 TaxID=935263 RepID=UPI00119C87A3|nr:AI-2E family transporter [Mesorhizobium sp. J18]TWG98065.1 putative PurR-regulated permease PerM [Mesorhizobium sp. J18]